MLISFILRCVRNISLPAIVLLLAACATPPMQPFGSDILIWDSTAKKMITSEQLTDRSRSADFVLIGETHDNPIHHRIQQSMLTAISANDRRPTLVMEQFDFEQQTVIDSAMSANTSRVDALKILQKEMARGWDWPQYRPLIEIAKDRSLPLKAANLSRIRLQQVSRLGFDALGDNAAARLALDAGWSDAQQKQLEKDIVEGHCGMLAAAAAAPIVNAQRARDAMMADTLLQVGSAPAIAILGRGHVRRDLAVPLYLAARAPKRIAIVLGLVDFDEGQMPGNEALNAMAGRYDYVVMTPAVKRNKNLCDGLVMPAMPAAK